MKYAILPVACLSLIFAIPTHAQRIGSPEFRQVSAVQPASPTEMTPRQLEELRADILMARKLYPEAIKSYEHMLKNDQHNATLLNKLGIAYEDVGNDGRAEREFKRAIKADKTYASAYNNVGTVEFDRRKYRHAIDWYQKTIALQPDMAVTYSNMGYAYFDLKKYPEAISSFQRAIRIDPQVMTQVGENGSILQHRGTPDPGLFYFLVARTYAELGNAERCAHYLKMSRDVGYTKFVSAKTDPTFRKVISDSRVQAVFVPIPELANAKPR